MPRGAGIDDFAPKLRLALLRANLSRAQLAQRVGVDKSVVARWLNGALQPSDHRLGSLTATLARDLAGFGRADWALAAADFARRIGLAAPEEAPGPGVPAAAPILGRAQSWAAEARERTDPMYAGLWAMVFPAPTLGGRIYCAAARISNPPGAMALQFEYGNGAMLHNRGPAFAIEGRLWVVMETMTRRDTLASLFMQGVVDEPALILDGLLTARRNTAAPALFCSRARLFRLGADAADERFRAVVERAAVLLADRWERRLPAALLAAFARPAAPSPNWVLIEPADAWTLGAWQRDDAARAPQIEALDHVRAEFGSLAGPLPP